MAIPHADYHLERIEQSGAIFWIPTTALRQSQSTSSVDPDRVELTTRNGQRMPTSNVTDNQPAIVYGVHAVRAGEICATRYVSRDIRAAERYAAELSRDPGVLAAAVTAHAMDTEGRNTATALYVAGVRQEMPHCSDDRGITANGHGWVSTHRPRS
jgi:hypothetical protein